MSMVWQSIRQNPENCSNFNMEWVVFIRRHKIIKTFCITFSWLNSLDFISRQHWNPKSHCVPFLMEMNGEKISEAEKMQRFYISNTWLNCEFTESSKAATARKKLCCLLSFISCNWHQRKKFTSLCQNEASWVKRFITKFPFQICFVAS